MKCVYLLTVMLVVVAAESYFYKTENDYVDVDAIFADPNELRSYLDCYLDRQPCTSLAASYKQYITDSVIRACDRCTLPQKQRYAKFLFMLRRILPQEYFNFRQKYDPFGIYFDRLEAELVKYLDYNTLVSPYYYFYKK